MAGIMAGCRSIPTDFEPAQPTHATPPASRGDVADFSRAWKQRGGHKSGFLLLADNAENLSWRLALIDASQSSIDVQTYLWASDFSGRLLFDRMQRAADRGVRVRLLVDDFLTRGKDRNIAALDQHPNIEIRMWNPGSARKVGRNLDYLVRLRELNHRLHNKMLIVDNRVIISGGRNIADAYFGLSDDYNFLDLDLLGVGPVVAPASKMFDRYWNADQAVPGRVLHGRARAEDIPAVTADRRKFLAASSLSKLVPLEPRSWDKQFSQGLRELLPGEAEVIYDKPGEREPSQDALVGLQRFFEQAKSEVQAANAYLVPGDPFFALAAKLEKRGVRMAVISNSLGSTNQTVVHPSFARSRIPMLKAGVEVFEMNYHPAMQRELDMAPVESSWVGLHAKAAVIDRKRVFIGSFNFSPRSRNLNTEMGLLVDSPQLGRKTAALMDKMMSADNAWEVRLGDAGQLTWVSSDGTLTRQPAQSLGRRWQNRFFSLLPVEEHL